jgi:hypothetical protein
MSINGVTGTGTKLYKITNAMLMPKNQAPLPLQRPRPQAFPEAHTR